METSYKTIFDRFSIYLLGLFISPILFGVFMAIYSIIAFQDSWSFGPTVLVVALYSWPFFGFGAFPISLFIDFSARMKDRPNWVKALIYAGSGGIAGLIAGVIFYDLFSMILMFLFGMVGGVIHHVALLLIKKLIKL